MTSEKNAPKIAFFYIFRGVWGDPPIILYVYFGVYGVFCYLRFRHQKQDQHHTELLDIHHGVAVYINTRVVYKHVYPLIHGESHRTF